MERGGVGREVRVEKERLPSILLSPDSPYVPLQWMGGFDIYNEPSMDWLCANVPSTNGKLTQHVGCNILKLLSEQRVALWCTHGWRCSVSCFTHNADVCKWEFSIFFIHFITAFIFPNGIIIKHTFIPTFTSVALHDLCCLLKYSLESYMSI